MRRFTVQSYSTLAGFRREAEPWLCAAEEENNLLLSLIEYLGASGGKEPPLLRIVFEEGVIVGVALRTGQGQALVCSAMPVPALSAVWEQAVGEDPDLRELSGPQAVVENLLAERAAEFELLTLYGAYFATGIVEPKPCGGRLRVATASDRDLLVRWDREFGLEVTGFPRDPGARAAVEKRIAEGNHFLWEDGRPVCQAFTEARTARGIRINGVYTPRRYRGRGYASHCVAEVTKRLLSSGFPRIYLYTNMKNATANALYRAIGYRHVVTLMHVRLERPN